VEANNSSIGTWSHGAAGITNASALGYRAQVSPSDSLVLGSIARPPRPESASSAVNEALPWL
jgi:hypothetical protein